jgi:hypothetical protein
MGHLQQVDMGQAAGHQDRVDLLLDVAGQQEALPTEGPEEDDRDVVDRCPAIGRVACHGPSIGPQDPQVDRVELESIPGREQLGRSSLEGQAGTKRVIRRPRSDHARLEDPPDAVALDEARQAARVILVGVAQDQDIDPPVPRGNPGIELEDQAIRVRAAVDQHPAAAVALDEDGVALPHVEDGDVDSAIRPGSDADHRDGQGERHSQQCREARPSEAASGRAAGMGRDGPAHRPGTPAVPGRRNG